MGFGMFCGASCYFCGSIATSACDAYVCLKFCSACTHQLCMYHLVVGL